MACKEVAGNTRLVPHLGQLITSSLKQAMSTQVSRDVSPPATAASTEVIFRGRFTEVCDSLIFRKCLRVIIAVRPTVSTEESRGTMLSPTSDQLKSHKREQDESQTELEDLG